MRDLKKNQISMFYALYSDSIPVYDSAGRETLEKTSGYLHPVEFRASLSAGRSDAYESPFGNNVVYDRVILSSKTSLPITDNSLIWVDGVPQYDTNGNVLSNSADYQVSAKPLKTINAVKIAIKMLTTNKSSTGATTGGTTSTGGTGDVF